MTNFESILGNLAKQHEYERYNPSAFDEGLTMIQRMNKILHYLHEIGKVTDDTLLEWKIFKDWFDKEGLTENVRERLQEMILDGTFDDIINDELFKDVELDLSKKISDISAILTFDGENDLIRIAKTLQPENAITIRSQFVLDESPAPYAQLVAKPFDGGNVENASFVISFDSTGRKPMFSAYGLTTHFQITALESLESGLTHEVVAMWDKDSGNAQLYVNSVLAGESNDFNGSIRYNSDEPLYIGATRMNTTTNAFFFKGQVMKTQIWGKRLTLEEIRNDFKTPFIYDKTIPIPFALSGSIEYQNHATLLTRISDFADVEVFGKDSSGLYDLHAIHLGTKGKPVLMINGSMHGIEWHSCQYIMAFAEMLKNNTFPDQGFRDKMMQNYHLIIVPTLNPYGYDQITDVYIYEQDSARYNANGIDLNSNFNEGNQSEKETQNFIALIKKYLPFAYLDAHMFRPDYTLAEGNNIIIGNGHTETINLRNSIAQSLDVYSGENVTKWNPVNSKTSGLSRAYVARNENPYVPHTLSYITELVKPTRMLDGVISEPLSFSQIYTYGIVSVYYFISTSMDYLEHFKSDMIHHYDISEGFGAKTYDKVTQNFLAEIRGDAQWNGIISNGNSILSNMITDLETSLDTRNEVVGVSVLSTPNVMRKGVYHFHISGKSDAILFNEYLTSLGVTPEQYFTVLENMRMIVHNTINRNQTGMQTVSLYHWTSLTGYQLYGKFTRMTNSPALWGNWHEEVFIVEKGSDANGEYIRYSNGEQVCKANHLTLATDVASGTGLFRSNLTTWTYPKPFKAGAIIDVTGSINGSAQWVVPAAIPAASSVSINALCSVSRATPAAVNLRASGKWR